MNKQYKEGNNKLLLLDEILLLHHGNLLGPTVTMRKSSIHRNKQRNRCRCTRNESMKKVREIYMVRERGARNANCKGALVPELHSGQFATEQNEQRRQWKSSQRLR